MNVRASGLSPWLALSFFVAACTGDEKYGDETTASGTTEETDISDSKASWDNCTEITTTVPEIAQTVGSGDAPTAEGGTIVEGTYVMTAYEVWGASALTSDPVGTVWSFNPPGLQYRVELLGASGTWTTSGTTLHTTLDCRCGLISECTDDLFISSQEYTATATTIATFGNYINGGTYRATHTKQ